MGPRSRLRHQPPSIMQPQEPLQTPSRWRSAAVPSPLNESLCLASHFTQLASHGLIGRNRYLPGDISVASTWCRLRAEPYALRLSHRHARKQDSGCDATPVRFFFSPCNTMNSPRHPQSERHTQRTVRQTERHRHQTATTPLNHSLVALRLVATVYINGLIRRSRERSSAAPFD